MTLAEHLKAARLVKKLEGNKNKGRQVLLDHLIPYPAAVENKGSEVLVRILDFEDVSAKGPCRDSAIRNAQDVLLRCILTMIRESRPIPAPDQYLEFVEDQALLMVDPMAAEAA